MSSVRIKRIAAELRMRRRRLDAYRGSSPWPGKDHAWRFEQTRYDRYLVVAAEMLEVPVPDGDDGGLLPPDARAVLEDRLAHAGLDVMAPVRQSTGDVLQDGDLAL